MDRDRVITTEERSIIFHQQEQQRRKDKLARDEAGMQVILRHKASAQGKEAQEAEERRLELLATRRPPILYPP